MKSVILGGLMAVALAGSVSTSSIASTIYLYDDTDTHPFFLPGSEENTPGTYYRWFSSPQATLETDTTWETATTARLTGQIFSDTTPTTYWNVDIQFVNGRSFDDFTNDGGVAKVENNTPVADVQNWRFFELGNTAQLTFVAGPGGQEPVLNLEFFDLRYIFQVGIGASNKQPNDILGASAWIANINGTPWTNGTHALGDINITLTIPEPISATFFVGPALLLLRRRRSA